MTTRDKGAIGLQREISGARLVSLTRELLSPEDRSEVLFQPKELGSRAAEKIVDLLLGQTFPGLEH